MNDSTEPSHDDGMLPKSFNRLIGVLLLFISIGLMSLWGIFA